MVFYINIWYNEDFSCINNHLVHPALGTETTIPFPSTKIRTLSGL
jgi:hypothetical protein